MAASYWHGVEVIQTLNGSVPSVKVPDSAVIGLVGTAKKTDKFEYGKLYDIRSAKAGFETFGEIDINDSKNTLAKALAGIFLECPGARVIAICVGPGDTEDAPGVLGELGKMSGIYGLLKCRDMGVLPKILIAPGYSKDVAIQMALVAVAKTLKAVTIVEVPEPSDGEDKLLKINEFFANRYSSRMYPVYPDVVLPSPIGEVGSSVVAAGLIAKTDRDFGWWVSPSNRVMTSILGLTETVDYSLDPENPNTLTNLLNKEGIATIIPEQGFRLWGARTRANSTDPGEDQHKFLNVRRTRDFVDEAILKSHLWAVDRNITKNYIEDVSESINNFFRDLKSQGAILGGLCSIDKELNPPEKIIEGHITFDYEFTPPYPAERLTFRSILSNKYISEIFK